jgi:DNA-binding NarL/FixJ family response regulator
MGNPILSHTAERSAVCILSKSPFEQDSISQLINSHSRYQVEFSSTDYKLSGQVVKAVEPDIAIVSYHHGIFRGPRIAQQMMSENSRLRIIGYSHHCNARQVFRMLDAGALAFLSYDCHFAEWQEAIETVSTGRIFYNRHITTDVIDAFKMCRSTGQTWWRTRLTEEIIMYAVYLSLGHTRDELCQLMKKKNIAEVNNDLNAIYYQLGCRNKEEFINQVFSEEGFD